MSKRKLSGFKLKSEYERAVALAQAGRCADALPVASEIASLMKGPEGYRLLVFCLESLGFDPSVATLEGAEAFPEDPDLALRAGLLQYQRADHADAARHLRKATAALRSDPEVAARLAHALSSLGRDGEALPFARSAFERRPREVPALVFGLASLGTGDLEGAQRGFSAAAESVQGSARDHAAGLLGLVLFWKGDLKAALEHWRALDAAGSLRPDLRQFFAIAAAVQGDEAAARDALARVEKKEEPAALLARARVELALNKPEEALGALAPLAGLPEPLGAMVQACRGRALRMLGRSDEARAALEPLAGEASGTVGAMALVDLGRMKSDEGAHEEAAALFGRAVSLDPSSQDASSGLARARERLAWREAVAADAQSQVLAARAEAEAMRRAFAEREREMELLRTRLAEMERAAGKAERDAAQARQDAERARREAVRVELETQEAEVASRAQETLEKALGPALADCPSSLAEALKVAEATYQKAHYTELHPAAVAVLFSGALERALYLLLVRPFDQSLSEQARAEFLRNATREMRGTRAEYLDRFVEAFDHERKARAPSLGEIARAFARRNDPHLEPFTRFLREGWGFDEPTLDALARFIDRVKERLRDPVAHGRALELPQSELVSFRKELLLDFEGRGRGVLAMLLRRSKG